MNYLTVMNYLIYVPNDWKSTFSASKRNNDESVLKRVEYYFDWMAEHGVFYRFLYEDDFNLSLGLLSALNIPALGFPVEVGGSEFFDITFIKGFYFSSFSPIVLPTYVSSSNFKPCHFYHGAGSLTNRGVRRFFRFKDFDSTFKDFLYRYKNIDSESFMALESNEDYDNDIDCFYD